MRLNQSAEWYENQFRKDAEAPAVSVTVGRSSLPSSSNDKLAPPETQTQIANRVFRQQAQKIADVCITTRAGESEQEPIHSVEVPELRSAAFDQIVKLRSRLYRKYPAAIINIEFRARRELNEAEDDSRLANL